MHVPEPTRGRRGLSEFALLGGLYVFYCLSRVFADNDLGAARDRADVITQVESHLGIDIESWINRAVSGSSWLAVPADYWYSVLHYVVTPAALMWLYLRHRARYAVARNALVVGTCLGLVCYLAFPTAPPRLMGTSSYADTLALYAQFGWWSDHASAPAGLGGLTNELAAMPSLHVGWALWAAWVIANGRRRWPYIYPLGTALVVVATANHWVLDCVVGALVVPIGIHASNWLERARPTVPDPASDVERTSVSPHAHQPTGVAA